MYMKIKVFTPNEKFSKNSVIIADYRNINYNDESNTIQSKMADKYGIELYPILSEFNELVIQSLIENYGNCDWYIDKSLMENLREALKIILEL